MWNLQHCKLSARCHSTQAVIMWGTCKHSSSSPYGSRCHVFVIETTAALGLSRPLANIQLVGFSAACLAKDREGLSSTPAEHPCRLQIQRNSHWGCSSANLRRPPNIMAASKRSLHLFAVLVAAQLMCSAQVHSTADLQFDPHQNGPGHVPGQNMTAFIVSGEWQLSDAPHPEIIFTQCSDPSQPPVLSP